MYIIDGAFVICGCSSIAAHSPYNARLSHSFCVGHPFLLYRLVLLSVLYLLLVKCCLLSLYLRDDYVSLVFVLDVFVGILASLVLLDLLDPTYGDFSHLLQLFSSLEPLILAF